MKDAGPLFNDFGRLIDASESDLLRFERRDVRPLLVKHGALLFRQGTGDVLKFKLFTDQCCLEYMTHMGVAVREKFSQFGDDLTVTAVTEGENDLALHGEMYHSPGTPEVIWFYCQEPATVGGATTLADGHSLYLGLSPKLRDMFTTKRLRYRHIDPPQVWRPRYGVARVEQAAAILNSSEGVHNLRVDTKGNLIYDYLSFATHLSKTTGEMVFISNIFIALNPANRLRDGMLPDQATLNRRVVEVEFEDGAPVTCEVLEEIMSVGAQITHEVPWHAHDILMVDNTRLLHGRRAFQGRRVIVTRIAAVA